MNTESTTRKFFFVMVEHPMKGWIRVGNAYSSRATAIGWGPIVRGAWCGCRVKVSQFTARFVNGKLDERSREVLDKKYNLTTEGL